MKKSADLGNAHSMNYIGNYYKDGIGTKQDFLKAKLYYEKAIQGGSQEAVLNMATLFYTGLGV
jgi:uncharacterized protein